MGSHSLLQGIFLTQGLNSGLLHCRQTVYCLRHQGSTVSHLFCGEKVRSVARVSCTRCRGAGSRRVTFFLSLLCNGVITSLWACLCLIFFSTLKLSLHLAHSFVSLHSTSFCPLGVLWGLRFHPSSWVPHMWLCFRWSCWVLTLCQEPIPMHTNINSFLSPITNLKSKHYDYLYFPDEKNQVTSPAQDHTANRQSSQASRLSSLASKPHPESFSCLSLGTWLSLYLSFRIRSCIALPGHRCSGCHCSLFLSIVWSWAVWAGKWLSRKEFVRDIDEMKFKFTVSESQFKIPFIH